MGHLSGYENFGFKGKGLHRVGTTLSIALMQISVRPRKVMVKLAAERIKSYVWLDEMVIGKVDEVICYNTGQNTDRKSSLCCTTLYCIRVLLRPHMGFIRVESFFPFEECLIGKQHFSRENGICSTLSKIPLCKKKYEMLNHPVAVPGYAASETDACRNIRQSSRP